MRPSFRLEVLLLLALLVAACGGTPADEDTGLDPIEETSPTVDLFAPSPEEMVEEETLPLGVTLYYAGFAMTLDQAELYNDECCGPSVRITGWAENLRGADVRAPSPELQGGSTGLGTAPMVPANSSEEVEYVFTVDPTFELTSAVVTFGGAEVAQARMILGAPDEAVTREAVAVDLTGAFDVGEITVTIDSATIRFDHPLRYEQAPAGKAYLYVTHSVAYHGDFPVGYSLLADQQLLQTPKGETLTPIEFPIGRVLPEETVSDLLIVFEFYSDQPGTYTFEVIYLPNTDDQEVAAVDFVVSPIPS